MADVSIRVSSGFNLKEPEFRHDIAGQMNLFDLLTEWSAQNAPEVLKRFFDPETELIASTTLILLNGRSVKSDNPKTTMVSPGDSIYITPILLGG